jgi:hypothetical protein
LSVEGIFRLILRHFPPSLYLSSQWRDNIIKLAMEIVKGIP